MLQKPSVTWDTLHDELVAFVYARTKDKATAKDIVHDVFLKVHAKFEQLKDQEKISAWIYQITRNTITDYFRSKSKNISPHDIDWDSDDQVLNECVANCLHDMLLTLPEKYRQALELAELRNLSQTELALRLQISYSGAKSRVQRARQMLKEKMDASYRIEVDSYGNVIVCENRLPCNCSERMN